MTLDKVINEFKKNSGNNKIDLHHLSSGTVTYLEEIEAVENPNIIRYSVTHSGYSLEYNDVEIRALADSSSR